MTPAQTPPWRGSLLPLGCAAVAKPDDAVCLKKCRGLLRRPAGASSLATGVCVEPNIQPNAAPCGSGLAREGGGSACINVECAAAFANPLPHRQKRGKRGTRNGGQKRGTDHDYETVRLQVNAKSWSVPSFRGLSQFPRTNPSLSFQLVHT
jgi:hypothetical protein